MTDAPANPCDERPAVVTAPVFVSRTATPEYMPLPCAYATAARAAAPSAGGPAGLEVGADDVGAIVLGVAVAVADTAGDDDVLDDAGAVGATLCRVDPPELHPTARAATATRTTAPPRAGRRRRFIVGTLPRTPCDKSEADRVPRSARAGAQRVRGKPRSTVEVAGSGQRDVTTLPRV